MERLTKPAGDGTCQIDAARLGEAAARLAAFENAYEELVARQNEIQKELDKLRAEGRVHSLVFKELTAKKVMGQTTLGVFRSHGIPE